MGPTIYSEIQLTNFIDNPIKVAVEGSNEVIQNGTAGFWQIESTTGITPGTYIELSWPACPLPGNKVRMECVPAPDYTGFQYHPTTGVSLLDELQDVAVYFNFNYYLKKDFDIQANLIGFPFLGLTPRTLGPDYELTITTTDPTLIIHSTPGTPTLLQPNYAMRVECFVSEDTTFFSNFKRLPGIVHKKKLNGQSEFDLSGMLQPWVFADDLNPELLSLTTSQCRTYDLLRFYLQYYEEYGNPPTIKKINRLPVSTDEYFYLQPGGIGKDDFRFATNAFGSIDPYDIFLYFFETGSLLTPRPGARNITMECPDFATFYEPYATLDWFVKARVWYTDGSDVIHTIMAKSSVGMPKRHTFTTGFKQNGLDSLNPSLQPYKYEVYLEYDDGSEMSGPIRYHIMPYEAYIYRFLYLNSFGCFEVLECRSKRKQTNEKSADTIYPVTDILQTKSGAEIEQFNINHFDTFELNTGALASKEEAIALKDFINSPAIYEIFKKTPYSQYSYVRVLVENGKYDLNIDGDSFPNVAFNYRYASDEKHFSDLKI